MGTRPSLRPSRRLDPGRPRPTNCAAAGWVLYTWFNPFEPFLWSLEFMPLWVVMLADLARSGGRGTRVGLGLVALAVGTHNWFALYLPFR